MDHHFYLRNDLPEAATLEKVLELLLAFVAADSVYYSPHLEDDLNKGVLLVVLGEESLHYWDEVYQNCEKLFSGFPQFSFRVFDREWIAEELKDGNPFFVVHCNRNALLYCSPNSAEIGLIDALKPKRFVKTATHRFRLDDETASTVAIDLRYYLKNGNLLQAAYVLQQSIRWLYITASRFLTGEWFVADDLLVQQQHIAPFSNTMGRIFDSKLPEGIALLELLNEACKAVQTNAQPPLLTTETLIAIELKKGALRNEVQQLFEACLIRCRYQFSLNKQPLIVLDEADPLAYITSIITESVNTSALYCIGERTVERKTVYSILAEGAMGHSTTHYYLLLFVNKYVSDAPSNIADKIKTATNGRYTVTVLMHSKKVLATRNDDQRYFFHQAMEHGKLLFQESARPPRLSFTTPPVRNPEHAKRYVARRQQTVAFFMQAETQATGQPTKMKLYLLHLIVEHTCLGLIRQSLGYTPYHFTLPFLFEICEYFSPLTQEFFPREAKKDKALLKLLSISPNDLRQGAIDDVAQHDYEVLRERCLGFARKVNVEVRSEK